MRLRSLAISTAALLVSTLLAPAAHPQPGPPPIESFEASILKADTVYLGTVAEPGASARDHLTLLHIEDTLKGAPRKTLAFFTPAAQTYPSPTRLLILIGGDPTHPTLIVKLSTAEPTAGSTSDRTADQSGPVILSEDCAILQTPTELLNRANTSSRLPPSTRTFDWLTYASDRHTPCDGRVLIVPIDSHLEQNARALLTGNQNVYPRRQAIQALAHFRSPPNILLLESFLADSSEGYDPEQRESIHTLGYERHFYTLRNEAFVALTAWGLHPPKPILRTTIYKPEAVTEADWTNIHGATTQDLRSLARFPNLTSLALENLNLTDSGYRAIATLTPLKNLLLAGTNINDRQLAILAPLTHLIFLNLFDTHISDASLPLIRSLPALEEVMLTRAPGCITQAAVDSLQRARPALKIDFYEPVPPWQPC